MVLIQGVVNLIGTEFALRNRRKSLCSKGLRRGGRASVALSPYVVTSYVNSNRGMSTKIPR